ncbi:MAG: hypothetical protein R6W78_09250 [Bacteroidales bacterium]
MTSKNIQNVIIAVVLLSSIIFSSIRLIKKSKNRTNDWTEEAILNFKKNSKNELLVIHPEYATYERIINTYCDCLADNIVSNLTLTQYNSILNEPQAKQIELLSPLIKECVDSLDKNLEPFYAEIQRNRLINLCVKAEINSHNLDSIQATEYCKCIFDSLISEYSLDSILSGSVKSVSNDQKMKCMEKIRR